MLEKRFYAVPPQLFTADGTEKGVVKIAANVCSLFKVKQKVVITATGLPNLNLEIKQIDANDNIQVGPIPTGKPGVDTSIRARTDISAYTVALGALIYANEQIRQDIGPDEINRATYEEEPTVAQRSVLVDECGNKINELNPLPVAATFDGDVHIGSIRITACDDDPNVGDTHSSVRIAGPDCDNEMIVNPDGSINVVSTTETVTTPTIQNFNVLLANTEYSVVLPANTKRFIFKSRSGDPKIQLSYVPGNTNTQYITIRPGAVYGESAMKLVPATPIYFRSNKPNETIEIVSWV